VDTSRRVEECGCLTVRKGGACTSLQFSCGAHYRLTSGACRVRGRSRASAAGSAASPAGSAASATHASPLPQPQPQGLKLQGTCWSGPSHACLLPPADALSLGCLPSSPGVTCYKKMSSTFSLFMPYPG
jgi:hypothetical protein